MSFRMLRVCALGGLLVAATTLRAAEPAIDFSGDIRPIIAKACFISMPRCSIAWASTAISLTYRFQGRDFRLTDVHGTVVKNLAA